MITDDQFYKDLLDNLYDGVYYVDKDRQIAYWNKGAEKITGYSSEEVVGKHCFDDILVHVDVRGESLCRGECPLMQTIRNDVRCDCEAFLKHHDGHRVPVLIRTSPIYGPDHEIIGAVEIFSDNSNMLQTRLLVDDLEQKTIKDLLTGLHNRHYITTRLEASIKEVQNFGSSIGVLFMDIDHFKNINDNYGHEAGDLVLKTVSQTLNHNIRSSDAIGRWGGEEFVAILTNLQPEYIAEVANKIRLLVENTQTRVDNYFLRVTISIGGTLIRPDDTVETILQRTDQLLYRSKSEGRNRVNIEL